MESLEEPKRRNFYFVTKRRISVEESYRLKYLYRTKTTAASINAKTKAALLAKAATNKNKPGNKAKVNLTPGSKNTTSNASSNTTSKSTTLAATKTQISAPKDKAAVNEAQRNSGKNGKASAKGKSLKQSRPRNQSDNSRPKLTNASQLNPKIAIPGAELGKSSSSSISEKPKEKRFNLQNHKSSSKPQAPSTKPKLDYSSNASGPVGSIANVQRLKPLPPNYNATKRKVTMAIVALPIALVTSWVLFERLVLGKERKMLVPAETSTPKEDN